MKLELVSASDALSRSRVRAGDASDPGSPAHLADELRAHVLALGSATRSGLVRRVTSLLEPVCGVEAAQVEKTCRALERRGDVASGPGGMVAAAPLRLVETHGNRLLVIGSFPTATLRRLLPDAAVSAGVGRSLVVPETSRTGLRETVETLGGRLLSAEDWAGLSRAPHADPAWLESLAQRLSGEGDSDGAGLTTRWDEPWLYDPLAATNAAWRWRRTTTTETPGLVRARQAGGWFAYGWGVLRGASEVPRPFVGLTRDEARRTELAVDRAVGARRSLMAELRDGLWWLALDVVVPAAEYRFLLAMAEEREEDRAPVRLGFSTEGWTQAAAMLAERLGVTTSASTQ